MTEAIWLGTEAEIWLGVNPESRQGRDKRDAFVKQFSYAILTESAIPKIAKYGPLVEVGCGTGYWAHELKQAGVDVIATDSGEWKWEKRWTDIELLPGVEAVAKYPARNLLMVWPTRAIWSHETLQAFTGQVVLYVGENGAGCTGSDEFHHILHNDFDCIETVSIPQFLWISDTLTIWQRKVKQ